MIYKYMFWAIVIILLLIGINKYSYKILFYFQIILIYLWFIPQRRYLEWYIQRHGWERYKYQSKSPESLGKYFNSNEMWVHKDYKNDKYEDNGEYALYGAYIISKNEKREIPKRLDSIIW